MGILVTRFFLGRICCNGNRIWPYRCWHLDCYYRGGGRTWNEFEYDLHKRLDCAQVSAGLKSSSEIFKFQTFCVQTISDAMCHINC
jgi:hypothetical protein